MCRVATPAASSLALEVLPAVRRDRDRDVVQPAEHLGVVPSSRPGKSKNASRLPLPMSKKKWVEPLVVAVLEQLGQRELEQALVEVDRLPRRRSRAAPGGGGPGPTTPGGSPTRPGSGPAARPTRRCGPRRLRACSSAGSRGHVGEREHREVGGGAGERVVAPVPEPPAALGLDVLIVVHPVRDGLPAVAHAPGAARTCTAGPWPVRHRRGRRSCRARRTGSARTARSSRR